MANNRKEDQGQEPVEQKSDVNTRVYEKIRRKIPEKYTKTKSNLNSFKEKVKQFNQKRISPSKNYITNFLEKVFIKMFKTNPAITVISIIGIFIFLNLSGYIITVGLRFAVNVWDWPLFPSNLVTSNYNAIIEAAALILVSVGLTMTRRVRKFGNFSHAEFITVGLYTVIATSEFFAASIEIANSFEGISNFLQTYIGYLFVQVVIVFLWQVLLELLENYLYSALL